MTPSTRSLFPAKGPPATAGGRRSMRRNVPWGDTPPREGRDDSPQDSPDPVPKGSDAFFTQVYDELRAIAHAFGRAWLYGEMSRR